MTTTRPRALASAVRVHRGRARDPDPARAVPYADSAAAVIAQRPDDQRDDLTHKAHMGPYSNNVTRIDGTIELVAIDRGASGDSVSGVATFTAQDARAGKVLMDRVQTRDIPDNPRFGGVIMGLLPRRLRRAHAARAHDPIPSGAVGVRPRLA
jgi:hypothetical protein